MNVSVAYDAMHAGPATLLMRTMFGLLLVGLPLLFALRASRWWYIGVLFASFPAVLFVRGAVDPELWAIWSEYPVYVVQQIAMGVAALVMLACVIVWRVRRIRSSRPAI